MKSKNHLATPFRPWSSTSAAAAGAVGGVGIPGATLQGWAWGGGPGLQAS